MNYNEKISRIDTFYVDNDVSGLINYNNDSHLKQLISREMSDIDIRLLHLRLLWFHDYYNDETSSPLEKREDGTSIEGMYKSFDDQKKFRYLYKIINGFGFSWGWRELVKSFKEYINDPTIVVYDVMENNNSIALNTIQYWFTTGGYIQINGIPKPFYATLNYPDHLDMGSLEDWADYLFNRFIEVSVGHYRKNRKK